MRRLVLAVALTAATALSGCSSGALGDLGGILGSPSSSQASDIRGQVTNVNTSNQTLTVDVGYVNNLREQNNGQTIYYTSNTRVLYNNNTYAVTDLERGDEVSIRGANDNGRYVAETITVTRNVRQ
jgi:hypothetical protein